MNNQYENESEWEQDNIVAYEWVVKEEANRLDTWLSDKMEDVTRSRIKNIFEEGGVRVNGQLAKKAGQTLRASDVVSVKFEIEKPPDAIAQKIDFDVLYEDDDVIIVNKPRGLVVHPAPGHPDGTLVNGLLHRYKGRLSDINGILRPGIVHRIDKNTSGIMVVARNNRAHHHLSKQFSEHTIQREYIGICKGVLTVDKGVIKTKIARHPTDRKKMAACHTNGKDAITHFQTLQRTGRHSLFRAVLETGRTHQIRVHMAFIGHPLAGDDMYGTADALFEADGQLLHAEILGFVHPSTQQTVRFTACTPAYFEDALQKMEKDDL